MEQKKKAQQHKASVRPILQPLEQPVPEQAKILDVIAL
jgi:hypothetical protein